jgi:hypothetical protein
VIASAMGVALSLVFWIPQLFKGKLFATQSSGFFSAYTSDYIIVKYKLSEIIFAPSATRIDQATGWGIAASILLGIGILLLIIMWRKTFSLKDSWVRLHLLLWLAFLLYIVFAPSFGLPSVGTSRAWAYLAIPVALVITEGVFVIASTLTKNHLLRLAVILVIAALIGITSIPAKIAVQTSQWPPGVRWSSSEELGGYVQMSQALPKNTRVYPVCSSEIGIVGFDMQTDYWNVQELQFRNRGLNITGPELAAFLQAHNYEYATLDASCVQKYGESETQAFVNSVSATGRFTPAMSSPGFLLVKLV